ncbi:MAG: acetoin utilization protein AcuC [Alphaproteobacteria bacterium]|nr:acetoin utilization protein AcuC [Alphaproteobacteria bacterium]
MTDVLPNADTEQNGALAPVIISAEIYRQTGYGSNHPLAIPRVGAVLDLCDALGWFAQEPYTESYVASIADITRFHEPDYVAALIASEDNRKVSAEYRKKHNIGTMENPLFPGLFDRASTCVGGSIQAGRLAMEGRTVYHPSGGTHHGMAGQARGFCYFNDVVFAILALLDHGAGRVLYVDLDAHHGDGVQAAFETDPRVMTISIHEQDRWPHTGLLDDRGGGLARNLPVPQGFCDDELAFIMDEAVGPLAEEFAPDAVVVCCGADALTGDPLSTMSLSNGALWSGVQSAIAHAGSAVVVGGGGYNPWTVARCWTGLWGKIAGYALPVTLPEAAKQVLAKLECDLIDEEDVEAAWLNTLVDAPSPGPIRPEVKDAVRTVLSKD